MKNRNKLQDFPSRPSLCGNGLIRAFKTKRDQKKRLDITTSVIAKSVVFCIV